MMKQRIVLLCTLLSLVVLTQGADARGLFRRRCVIRPSQTYAPAQSYAAAARPFAGYFALFDFECDGMPGAVNSVEATGADLDDACRNAMAEADIVCSPMMVIPTVPSPPYCYGGQTYAVP